MDIFDVLTLIGGLALFLYGMSAMGDGLTKTAGGKLGSILETLTSKRIYAVLLGLVVTGIIQSSSATTVMVVGFVNSGIMQLSQAVGIIMGANIGTTVTSWILSLTGISGESFFINLLKPSSFSPVLAAIGIILIMAAKDGDKKKDIGNILVGFAILMFGMETMSGSVAGLSEDEGFCSMLTAFSDNPILGVAVGTILTAIIQSSSASVGILQALCLTGAVSFGTAIPIIMGQNIGTCVTAIISSIGANRNAKRAAAIHLLFNLIGTVVFLVVFYTINAAVHFEFLAASASPAGVAVVHSLFNIATVILLFPFADYLVKLSRLIIPESGEEIAAAENEKALLLDERFLENPSFAIELCKQKTQEMARLTKKAMSLSLKNLLTYDKKTCAEVIAIEDEIDDYEDVLGSYLVKLSAKDMSKKDSQSLSLMLHSISDFERISDHAVNLVESAQEMKEKKLSFSNNAREEIETLTSAVNDIIEMSVDVFCNEDTEKARHVEPLEQVIDRLTKKIKALHVKRLQKGKCSIEMGFVHEDILTNLERVSDHCSNIAVELLTISEDGYDTHEFYEDLSAEEKNKFDKEYKALKKKYSL